MIEFSSVTLNNIILAGYVFSGSLLNIVALFISSFYQHRLHQSSPQAGFVVAVILSFVYILLIFTGAQNSAWFRIASFIIVVGYSIASAYSILILFITMRSIRK